MQLTQFLVQIIVALKYLRTVFGTGFNAGFRAYFQYRCKFIQDVFQDARALVLKDVAIFAVLLAQIMFAVAISFVLGGVSWAQSGAVIRNERNIEAVRESQAQVPSARPSPVAQAPTVCWLSEEDGCVVKAPYRGLQILPSQSGPLLALWRYDQYGKVPSGVEHTPIPISPPTAWLGVAAVMKVKVEAGIMSTDDALAVFAEISKNLGFDYQLPASLAALKFAIGFPPYGEIPVQEYLELVRVQMQIALGISQKTAHFLVDCLGLEETPLEIREVQPELSSSAEVAPSVESMQEESRDLSPEPNLEAPEFPDQEPDSDFHRESAPTEDMLFVRTARANVQIQS